MHRFGTISSKVAGALALLLLTAGCQRTEEFPVEPRIELKSFTTHGDSASLVITFTDGDGDIGLGQGDTLPPYDVAPWFYNLFLDYEEKQNGVWVRPALLLPLYYRVPVITPSGQDKTLEGELAVALTPWPTIPNTPFDTVRYVVKLVDRALHESNTITTGPIVLP
ncbi:MAG TPA: hypothetical protein PLH93_00770 [Flavobacteriales bacterium]|nr:hypothetical protein [Flavobacteriales bacterium]HQW85680.1 hypothetical protein [Flavobacteriales bacterium]